MSCLPIRLLPLAPALAALLLLGVHAASAQPPPTPPAAGGDLRPGEIEKLFDAYVVMEAQQALGLSDAQFAPFLSRLRALQEARRQHLSARAALLADLGRMSGPRAGQPSDDARLRTQLAALRELDARSAAESRKAYGELDALLKPRQQARFRVFEDQLERRKLELMLRARQNARQERLQQRRQR